MLSLVAALILYTLVFAAAELLYHRGVEVAITRKITHIGAGIVSAGLPFLVTLPTALGLGLFF